MEDFTKKTKVLDSHLPREAFALPNKKTSWLTQNRLWNLIFLFVVPAEIYLAALMWNAWMLILPLATTIVIFGFAPVDTSAADNKEPHAVKAIRSAAYIWLFTTISFGFAASKILSLVGITLGQFGFGEVIFFIFLIPVSILCYFNIPLASCVEAKDASEMSRSSSNLFDHSNTMAHRRLSPSQSWRSENVFKK